MVWYTMHCQYPTTRSFAGLGTVSAICTTLVSDAYFAPGVVVCDKWSDYATWLIVTFCRALNISCLFLRFFVKSLWWCGLKWKHNASKKQHQVTTLLDPLWRHLLIKLGFWGQQDEPIRVHLHRAYLQFKEWCSSKRISCSQPCFQEKLVPRWNFITVFGFSTFSTWLLKTPKVTHRFFGKLTLHIQCSWVVYENGWDSAPLQSLQWSSSDAVAYWDCCSSSWNRALQISWWYYIHCGPGHAS